MKSHHVKIIEWMHKIRGGQEKCYHVELVFNAIADRAQLSMKLD